MRSLSALLFYIWLLSLPFYRYSLIGTLAFDQILGSALVVLWLAVRPKADEAFTRGQRANIIAGLILLTLYFFSHTLTFVLSQSAIWRYTYRFLADIPYFLVPVLYVRSALIRRRAEDYVVLVALIGALSSFLVAYGIFDLPIARESADRLAIEGLELTRATGFFGAFGDMAILSAFSLMIVMSAKRETLLFFKRSWIMIIGIPFALLLGFVGSQSRNIALTVVVSISLYLLIGWWAKRRANWIPKFYLLLFIGAMTIVITLGFFFEPLFDYVATLGGRAARGTAEARLEQYEFGLKLLDGRYLSGAPPAVQDKYGLFINSIHNMWIKELVIGGFFAVLAMLAFLIVGIMKATRCLRVDPLDQAARLRLVLCITLFLSTQFNPSGTSVYWVMLGLIFANVPIREPEVTRAQGAIYAAR
ncbi:MAG: hypothetical protein OEQ74_08545 [Gammaproteobacteria bacterium]|nr:hypothetical protein [Gammaproteobacteria bacterium]